MVEDKDWDFENSPTLDKNKWTGTHFGNCGETYPFLHILQVRHSIYQRYELTVLLKTQPRLDDQNKGKCSRIGFEELFLGR